MHMAGRSFPGGETLNRADSLRTACPLNSLSSAVGIETASMVANELEPQHENGRALCEREHYCLQPRASI